MKITLLQIGKTEDSYLQEGISKFEKRLSHYVPFQTISIPALKNTKNISTEDQKKKEAELILKQLQNTDSVYLLDEKGRELSSVNFAGFFEQHMLQSTQHLVFVIGGPYGFDKSIYERCEGKISLSKMTFSHQMIRLLFVEQLYRALSILRGEPYHHA